MRWNALGRGVCGAAVAAAVALVGVCASAVTAQVADATSVVRWSGAVWDAARTGNQARLDQLLENPPQDLDDAFESQIRAYREHIREREQQRVAEQDEARAKLRQIVDDPDASDAELSEGLVQAIAWDQVALNPEDVFRDSDVRRLVSRAEAAARAAEDRGDWLMANELFYRLHTLFADRPGADNQRYKKDLDRLNRRLSMIQYYAPRELWRLRNERELAEGGDPLPAYVEVGESWDERLRGISRRMVEQALREASTGHVETPVDVRAMTLDGIDAIRTMLTTHELEAGIPGLRREAARTRLLDDLARERRRIEQMDYVSPSTLTATLREVLRLNRESGLDIMDEAIMHEFANGAFAALDEFSGIIWPDELRRFERNTNGNYVGIGVQIQLNEAREVEVVTPLDDTPAYRADIRSGDVIKTVDGKPTAGLSLNQVADIITGPTGTTVELGIERPIPDVEDGATEHLTIEVARDMIVVKTVKGWARKSATSWDWFIDDDQKIGYVRLNQFTASTTRELHQALREMEQTGLNGLILDLRFNPGGLLDEAVTVANTFITRGDIVGTQDGLGRRERPRKAIPSRARATDIPIIVLTNQSSASASEIVSGAIQDHAQKGAIDAMVVGMRTYGKGSVQNVWGLPGDQAAIKLTKRYYILPSGRLIHKRPGARTWGVEPNLEVSMLPSQTLEAVLLRREADMLPLVGHEVAADQADPSRLLDEGVDPQLETAVLLLKARTVAQSLSVR